MSGARLHHGATVEAVIADGAASLGVVLTPAQHARLAAYVALVGRWQHVTNLTGDADPRRFAAAHVVDCLALVPHLGAGPVVDVGSGAGLPAHARHSRR